MPDPFYETERVTLLHGDCRTVLAELPECSVDSIVTDPPYGLKLPDEHYHENWQWSRTVEWVGCGLPMHALFGTCNWCAGHPVEATYVFFTSNMWAIDHKDERR